MYCCLWFKWQRFEKRVLAVWISNTVCFSCCKLWRVNARRVVTSVEGWSVVCWRCGGSCVVPGWPEPPSSARLRAQLTTTMQRQVSKCYIAILRKQFLLLSWSYKTNVCVINWINVVCYFIFRTRNNYYIMWIFDANIINNTAYNLLERYEYQL